MAWIAGMSASAAARTIRPADAGSAVISAVEGSGRFLHEVAQDVMEDAAVAVIFELVERIDAHLHRHVEPPAIGEGDFGNRDLARLQLSNAADRYGLVAFQAQALPARLFLQHQRQHAHSNEVGAVDAL